VNKIELNALQGIEVVMFNPNFGPAGYFAAALHSMPCAYDGGDVYLNGDGALDHQAAIIDVYCHPMGNCLGFVERHWFVRSEDIHDVSVVLYDTPRGGEASEKMICFDLKPSHVPHTAKCKAPKTTTASAAMMSTSSSSSGSAVTGGIVAISGAALVLVAGAGFLIGRRQRLRQGYNAIEGETL